jgi:hypothetical protein
MHLAVNIGGIPHLAKNERDVGHPSFVRGPDKWGSHADSLAMVRRHPNPRAIR